MKNKQVFHTASARETRALGKALAKRLKAGAVVCLEGGLGSGKTTFVKGLAAGLGFKHPEEVKSPTFVLLHVYHGRLDLYHFDLYRLESGADLQTLGLEEFINQPDAVCCLEWAERARPVDIPPSAVTVRFQIQGSEKRKIEIRHRA